MDAGKIAYVLEQFKNLDRESQVALSSEMYQHLARTASRVVKPGDQVKFVDRSGAEVVGTLLRLTAKNAKIVVQTPGSLTGRVNWTVSRQLVSPA